MTKRISAPPKIEDFAALKLPPDDVADLKHCRVGACELKLSEAALTQARKQIDWSKPSAQADAEQLARRLALDYVTGYLAGGNARLATYRDSSRPTFVGQEFASMVERMPSLTEYLPDLKRYLLEFPKASLPKSDSFLYWQEAKFGLKPTIRINHITIAEQPTHVAVASKMLYASHYFWTALELRVLVPDRGARRGLLVRQREPQPLGWPERIRGATHSRQGQKRGREGHAGRPHTDPGAHGAPLVTLKATNGDG